VRGDGKQIAFKLTSQFGHLSSYTQQHTQKTMVRTKEQE